MVVAIIIVMVDEVVVGRAMILAALPVIGGRVATVAVVRKAGDEAAAVAVAVDAVVGVDVGTAVDEQVVIPIAYHDRLLPQRSHGCKEVVFIKVTVVSVLLLVVLLFVTFFRLRSKRYDFLVDSFRCRQKINRLHRWACIVEACFDRPFLSMDRESFTTKIAEALHEIEAVASTPDRENFVLTTYQNLCYDDPVGISVQGCLQLQRALLDPKSPYALSPRLVAGIHQFWSSLKQPTVSSQHQPPSESSLLLHSGNETSESLGSAISLLAYCVHIEIPLQCCLAKTTLPQATNYLGSYFVHQQQDISSETNVDRVMEDVGEHAVNGGLNNVLNGEGDHTAVAFDNNQLDNGHNAVFETNSFEEIFAAESDDSDFEFESDWNPEAQTADLNRWVSSMEDSLNPVLLSKPPTNVTWDEIALSIAQLIELLPPALFSAISSLHWRRGMSDTMTQLCLALLIPASSKHSPLLTADSAVSPDRWQRLGVRLVNAFREFTMHQVYLFTSSSSHDTATCDATTSILEEYLRLLRILLQADQHSGSSKPTDCTSPGTLVGLSSLSELCHSVQMPLASSTSSNSHRVVIRIVQSNLFQVLDDLAVLLENSMNKSKEDITTIQWTYITIFQILTVSTRALTESHGLITDTLPKDYAQGLLNSGLFRHWLILWSQKVDASCQIAVQDCILDVSLASPSLLGKYAWRFPGLAQVVTSHGIQTESLSREFEGNVVSVASSLLWNILGRHVAGNDVSAPKIQWKSTSSTTTNELSISPTLESCSSGAISLFQLLSVNTLRVVTDWKLRRQHNIARVQANDTDKLISYEIICNDWKHLAIRVSAIPLLYKLLPEILSHTDGVVSDTGNALPKMRAELASIQRLLADWPISDKSDDATDISGKKSDRDEGSRSDEEENDSVGSAKR